MTNTDTVRIPIPQGKLKCPWMGIPIPGSRPIVLLTKHVIAAVAGGATITDTAVTEDRRFEVTYTHRLGRGRAVFADRWSGLLQFEIHKWADKQRKLRAAPVKPKLKGHEAEIARQLKALTKERSYFSLPIPPLHPLLPSKSHYDGNYLRESAWQWHEEKSKRKRLAKITGMVLKSKVTSTTAYKMLRDVGFEFVKFSEQPTQRGRRTYENQDGYWKHLPQFVHGMSNGSSRVSVSDWPDDEDESQMDKVPSTVFTRHRATQIRYLEEKRHIQTIDNQIAALKEMLVSELELTEPPATDWEALRTTAREGTLR